MVSARIYANTIFRAVMMIFHPNTVRLASKARPMVTKGNLWSKAAPHGAAPARRESEPLARAV
jgi:hypothetical protein